MITLHSDMVTNTVDCMTQGDPETLLMEMVMANISFINRLVSIMTLKKGKTTMEAKLAMADTICECVKNGLKIHADKPQSMITKERTANDVIKDATGMDMEEVHMQVLMMEELLNKWLPVMGEHVLSDTEYTMMEREVKEAGFTMDEFIDEVIQRNLFEKGGK